MTLWPTLALSHPEKLVEAVRVRIAEGTSREITLGPFSELGFQTTEIVSLLDELSTLGGLDRRALLSCPGCGGHIDKYVLANKQCPSCGHDFDLEGDEPDEVIRYFVRGDLSRDVPWLIAVHGFNTRGEWQRDFSWLVANKLRYHAPVLMYQYPMSRYGVMLRWRHKQLARELGDRVRVAIRHARENGIPEPPDVVAHSFGSIVLVTLLDLPDYQDLVFGRIILAGSIVSPSYRFSDHLKNSRCDAVLNHCGGKDSAVEIAQYLIPASGPSGREGMYDPGVINVRAEAYGHGSFFTNAGLKENLQAGGIWDLFLRLPRLYVGELEGRFVPKAGWLPANGIVTISTRLFFVLVPLPVVMLALLELAQDVWGTLRSLLPKPQNLTSDDISAGE